MPAVAALSVVRLSLLFRDRVPRETPLAAIVYVPSFVPLVVSITIGCSLRKCLSTNPLAESLIFAGVSPDAAANEIVVALYCSSSQADGVGVALLP